MRQASPLATVLVALVAVGCGGGSEPGDPELIEEDPPSFKGVTVGEPVPANADELLGERCDQGAELTPCDLVAITGPHAVRGDWSFENHSEVTLLTGYGDVQALVVADDNAETARGVAIGDDLAAAKGTYRRLDCGVQQFEDSTGNPYCTGSLRGRTRILFGGDPIDSIVIGRGFG